jgi:hypothetical protein
MFYLPLPVSKMKNIRKYTLRGISIFLLLCFSVTILPVDALHSHLRGVSANTSCSLKGGETCQHKSHINNQASFCWACAVHIDSVFMGSPRLAFIPVSFPTLKRTAICSLLVFQSAIKNYDLRGPPTGINSVLS